MKTHLRTHKGRYVLAVLMLLALSIGYSFGYEKSDAEFVSVTRGSIAQEVIVTGKTQPIEEVQLGFERSGKVARVHAPVGTRVPTGALLISLEAADLYAAKLEAEARLDAERAKLAELRRGARPEEIRIEELKVANASSALLDAKQNLLDKLQDAFAKSDDAIRSKVDQFFSNPRSTNPQITLYAFPEKATRESERIVVEYTLIAWQASLANLTLLGDLERAAQMGKTNLLSIAQFLDRIASGVNTLSIETYRNDIAAARTSINTVITNLTTAKEKLRTARVNLALAEEELTLKRGGATIEEIAAQEARLKETEAGVNARAADIQKTILRAPFTGIVVIQNAKVGEIVGANSPIVALIGEAALEIEANIPEVDIGRVVVGNPVAVTIDAFPGEPFSGTVSFIEPAETIVDGVVNFKVTITLASQDARFKSGLTANLTIKTLEKTDVLIIPQFAVIETDEGTFVEQWNGKTAVRTPVTVGIRSQDGMVEIVEGLREGDRVVNVGAKANN